eukprot:9606316-Lingulodinium_polyedra.AAC.1
MAAAQFTSTRVVLNDLALMPKTTTKKTCENCRPDFWAKKSLGARSKNACLACAFASGGLCNPNTFAVLMT